MMRPENKAAIKHSLIFLSLFIGSIAVLGVYLESVGAGRTVPKRDALYPSDTPTTYTSAPPSKSNSQAMISTAPAHPLPSSVGPQTAMAPPGATYVPGTATISQGVSSKERRIALVIGNSKYANAPLLLNPQRDAKMVTEALKSTGFDEVTTQADLGKEALSAALQKFSRSARNADWAVVYFAGHGIEIGGVNYLVPIDAALETDHDAQYEAVPLNQVLNAVEGATKLRLVILDACRVNPFVNRMRREYAGRAVSRGFVREEPNPGTLVVYAAKDGEVASDGVGSNSPFSTAFVQNLRKPGLEINKLFRLVRDDVVEATKRAQTPYVYGSLSGREDFYFIGPK